MLLEWLDVSSAEILRRCRWVSGTYCVAICDANVSKNTSVRQETDWGQKQGQRHGAETWGRDMGQRHRAETWGRDMGQRQGADALDSLVAA
jgi:hypothetical protein